MIITHHYFINSPHSSSLPSNPICVSGDVKGGLVMTTYGHIPSNRSIALTSCTKRLFLLADAAAATVSNIVLKQCRVDKITNGVS